MPESAMPSRQTKPRVFVIYICPKCWGRLVGDALHEKHGGAYCYCKPNKGDPTKCERVDVVEVSPKGQPMEALDLLSTNDAMVWAQEFVKTCREHDIDPVRDDDPKGFMVGWFANAMAAQENADRRDG